MCRRSARARRPAGSGTCRGAAVTPGWLGDRLDGLPQLGSCLEPAPPPAPTANPGGGDLTVSLRHWALSGPVKVNGLGQSLSLPSASTFGAATDLTSQQLTGCGLLSPVLSLLFSGAGNTYSFTVAPPAPVAY